MPYSFRSGSFFSALLLLVAGCNEISGEASDARLGRFQLSRINGAPLPAFVTEGPAARVDFLSGAVHLETDGMFVDSTEVKVTPKAGGSITTQLDVAQGTYRVSGDTVYFSSTRGERYFMIYLSRFSLQQELSGSLLLYNR